MQYTKILDPLESLLLVPFTELEAGDFFTDGIDNGLGLYMKLDEKSYTFYPPVNSLIEMFEATSGYKVVALHAIITFSFKEEK